MTQSTTRTPGKQSSFTRRWRWNKRAPLRSFYNGWLRLFFRLFTRFTIKGSEHVPAAGGAIVMINHINFWDPLAVMPHLGRDVIPMTKVEAWEGVLRPFVGPYGAIPVHRGAVDTAAVRSATEALSEGQLVLISPEGTRSPDGALIQAQEGMAFLAARADASILPVAIQGTPNIMPNLKRLRRAEVSITIGPLFKLETRDEKPTRESLTRLTDVAMRQLAALLPEHMHGVYADEVMNV